MKKKRPFSLLEICIGLGLATLVITTLFTSLRQLMQTKAQMGIVRQSLHPQLVMHMRLNQIFSSISGGQTFFTDAHEKAQGQAIYFIHDNGVDHNPHFCGSIVANLYLNKDDELVLELENEQVQTLYTGITTFQFSFFDPEANKWRTSWEKSTLPPLIRIQIDDRDYSFSLPRAKQEVKYS